MKFSKFNIKAVDVPEKGKTAIFNTLTRGMAVFKNGELEGLEGGGDAGMGMDEIKSLEDTGVLVQEGLDEDLFFDVYYNQVRFDNTSLRIVLLTTLNCNFACYYCYEGDLTYGKKQMSLETAEEVISWIKSRAIEGRVSKIRIEYMGGEPLLNVPVIEKVGTEMVRFCEENGIKYVSLFISNGYLLTKKVAERVAAAGVSTVRVTIDGPEDVHDSVRLLRGGGGKTFNTIIKNLQECKDILIITVSSNFTRENADSMPRLLDQLTEAGLGPGDIYKIEFAPVVNAEIGGKAAAFDKQCVPMDSTHEIVIKGREELLKRGFDTYAEPEFSPCPAICSGDYTINWDGSLYKCPCLVGHSKYEVGRVREELTYNAEMVRCLGHNTFENPTCRNCNVLPLCLGGCRYMALVENGEFHSLDCQRKSLEAITLEAVKRMASAKHFQSEKPKE